MMLKSMPSVDRWRRWWRARTVRNGREGTGCIALFTVHALLSKRLVVNYVYLAGSPGRCRVRSGCDNGVLPKYPEGERVFCCSSGRFRRGWSWRIPLYWHPGAANKLSRTLLWSTCTQLDTMHTSQMGSLFDSFFVKNLLENILQNAEPGRRNKIYTSR